MSAPTTVSEIQTEGLVKTFGTRTVVDGVSLRFRAGEVVPLSGFPKISRATVARFLVEALASTAWSRRHVILTE